MGLQTTSLKSPSLFKLLGFMQVEYLFPSSSLKIHKAKFLAINLKKNARVSLLFLAKLLIVESP